MVREFAVLVPILITLLGGLVCRHGGAASERALGRARTRLLLLGVAGFSWLVSAMVLLEAACAVEPAGVTALAGAVIDPGALGPVALGLQWSADPLSLAISAALFIALLAGVVPNLLEQGRAAATGSPEALEFHPTGQALLTLAGCWALVFSHSLPAMVLAAVLLLFADGSAQPVSRRIPAGWTAVGWFALAAVTHSPGKPPNLTTLALVSAAGERSILLRTEVLSGVSYADVAALAAVLAFMGLSLARRTRLVAPALAAVLLVHLNGVVALSEWGMAGMALAGCLVMLSPWLRNLELDELIARLGMGLVLATAGMGQFIDCFWVGLSAPLVAVAATSRSAAWRWTGLGLAAVVWGPAAVMASSGASVASAFLNGVVGLSWLGAAVGLGARAMGEPAKRGARVFGAGSGVSVFVLLALALVVTARWIGPLTQPLRRLLALSAQFEGRLALGVLPWAQGWGPWLVLGLGFAVMGCGVAIGARLRPSRSLAARVASPFQALSTLVRTSLSMAHTLGLEVRNQWWSWRSAARPVDARTTAVRQLAWGFAAVVVAAAALHRCPAGLIRSETYDAPGLAPRLVSPKRPRPLHDEGQP